MREKCWLFDAGPCHECCFGFILTDTAVSAQRVLRMEKGGAVLPDLMYEECGMFH